MDTFEQAREYAVKQAEKLNKLSMNEFFIYIHSNYYPDQDNSFMNYFLELCDKEGQFVVEHTKLVEYGVMTSTESSKVKEKLDSLGLVINEDYLLTDVCEQVKSGTKHSKLYTLTPEAFKKCLMRTQRRLDQPIDPVIYCNYYLLLEKVFKLFTAYERAYSTKLLLAKDEQLKDALSKVNTYKTILIKKVYFKCNQYVYVATSRNYARQNVFKVGMTKSLEKRMSGYQTGRVHDDKFSYLFLMKCIDAKALEQLIFTRLEPFRYDESKELFQIHFETLKDILSIFQKFETESVNDINQLLSTYYSNHDNTPAIDFESMIISINRNTYSSYDTEIVNTERSADQKLAKEIQPSEYANWDKETIINNLKNAIKYQHSVYKFLNQYRNYGDIKASILYEQYVSHCNNGETLSKIAFGKLLNKHGIATKCTNKLGRYYSITLEIIQLWNTNFLI